MGKSKKKKKQPQPAKKLSPPQPKRVSHVYDVMPIEDDERDAWLLFESHIFSQSSFECVDEKGKKALIKTLWGKLHDFDELLAVFTSVTARRQDEQAEQGDEYDEHEDDHEDDSVSDLSEVELLGMRTFLTVSRDVLVVESCYRFGSGTLHYSKALSALLKFWKIKKPVGTLLMRYLVDNSFYERTAARYTIQLPAFTQDKWHIVQARLLTVLIFSALRGELYARAYIAQNFPMMTALFTEQKSATFFCEQMMLFADEAGEKSVNA